MPVSLSLPFVAGRIDWIFVSHWIVTSIGEEGHRKDYTICRAYYYELAYQAINSPRKEDRQCDDTRRTTISETRNTKERRLNVQ
jgi:hypothetical protein